MPAKRLVPGRTEGQLTARARSSKILPQLKNPPGGLYPLQAASFEVDEYRIVEGWPVAVPDYDIRIECLVDGDGIKLGDRDTPGSLITEADFRWIADVDYYDQTALLWRPIQGAVSPWETDSTHAPTLVTDYEYVIKSEAFINMAALNFDSDTADYMWNNLDLSMGGTMGYTVVMVMNPGSIYTTNSAVVSRALWGPQTTDDPWAMFTLSDQSIWMTTDEQPATKGVAIGDGLSSGAPSFIALVVRRPQTTVYAGSGPANIRSKALPSGVRPVSLSTRFWLGNGPFSSIGTIDMALLDLGIYGQTLTKAEVVDEFTKLSTIYGGDK